jgi:hypothetical protein
MVKSSPTDFVAVVAMFARVRRTSARGRHGVSNSLISRSTG